MVEDPGAAEDVRFREEFLSILIGEWLDALEPHLDRLLSPPVRNERSHCIAIVVLAAFAIESHASRIRLRTTGTGRQDPITAFLRIRLPGFPKRLALSVEELFLIRNALVHNDIWLMRGIWTNEGFTAEGIERLAGRRRATRLVRNDGRTTVKHQFSLVPELVGYHDARKAMTILVAVLDTLASLDAQGMRSPVDGHLVESAVTGRLAPIRAFARMPRRRPQHAWWPPHRDRRRRI